MYYTLINGAFLLLYGPNLPSPPRSVFLHRSRCRLQLQNNVFISPAQKIHCAFSRSVPFVTTYLRITHLFLIISLLIFQFSLLCRRPSLRPLSSSWLKAFHLSTISMPGPAPPPIRLTSYLPLYIPSSLLLLSLFSIFPPSHLLDPLCALYPFPLRPPTPPPPRLKLNPVGVSLARPRLPPTLGHTDPRNRP